MRILGMTTITEKPKQRRGFAVMSKAARLRIAAMGGSKTARKYGRKHMSAIGRNGRNKRTRQERQAKRKAVYNAAVNAALQDQDA